MYTGRYLKVAKAMHLYSNMIHYKLIIIYLWFSYFSSIKISKNFLDDTYRMRELLVEDNLGEFC